MRNIIHIEDRAYSREQLLIDLEALHWLQRESIRTGTTPSELINNIVLVQKGKEENAH